MKNLFLSLMLMIFAIASLSGCGPMDPPQYCEFYTPETGSGDIELIAGTVSYLAWGEKHYSGPPRIKIIEKDGRIWEMDIGGDDPASWRLWTWMPGEKRVQVPWRHIETLSAWECHDLPREKFSHD